MQALVVAITLCLSSLNLVVHASVTTGKSGGYNGQGGWGSWSPWSKCQATCGTGLRDRSRNCEGANQCQGPATELEKCDTKIKCPVDGHWSAWSPWTPCTASCGNDGTTRRLRQCDNPAPSNGGDECPGKNEIVGRCNVKCCPVDGQWGSWNAWGRCTRSCGAAGARIRHRLCNQPTPSPEPCPGKPCIGSDTQVAECRRSPCPIDGGWSPWSSWSDCSRTCGLEGFRQRNRTCTNPRTENTGEDCPGHSEEKRFCVLFAYCPQPTYWSSWSQMNKCPLGCGEGGHIVYMRHCLPIFNFGSESCPGNGSKSTVCDVHSCPVQGGWSYWSCWSSCSVTCGKGQRKRTRICSNPYPTAFGTGTLCTGQPTQYETCNGAAEECAVDGGWSTWQQWSQCPTCGGGNQRRYRLCDNPARSDTGSYCYGESKEDRSCNTKPCPIDGNWGAWSCWSACDVLCGNNGTRKRVRHCNNPSPLRGKTCPGISEDKKPCDGMPPCPRDGQWSSWSGWSEFDKTCGVEAVRKRDRVCNDTLPIGGGKTCPGKCVELDVQDLNPCSQNGSWSPWGCWSTCSKSCGSGYQIRHRKCSHPPPTEGGAECSGPSYETKDCDLGQCATNGTFSEWTPWSNCSKTCGRGYQNRSRLCDASPLYIGGSSPLNGGYQCSGKRNEVRTCFVADCPIDGGWSSWGCWSFCSATCGAGLIFRNRQCNNPSPANGGKNCSGYSRDMNDCNAHIPCTKDGSWESWEEWSSCSYTCGYKGIRHRIRHCKFDNARYRGSPCFGSSQEIELCNRKECPLDGGWSTWSLWSECSASCGAGVKHRQRNCTNPAPKYNGQTCRGDPVSTASCTIVDCPTDGGWGNWSAWSTCSPSCGLRSRKRTRLCDSPEPKDGGSNCNGSYTGIESCKAIPCPCDGQYSGWSLWSLCSVTCGQGGVKIRSRTCSDPPSSYGGAGCIGQSTQITECSAERPCAQNGSWSEYGSFSECNQICNGGIQVAYRTCSVPPPTNGGYECVGPNSVVRKCNTQSCPCDGVWGNWQAWSKCDKRCGIGRRRRTRLCDSPPRNMYGAFCPGNAEETRECWIHDCPFDGGWSSWGPFDSCNKPCGEDAVQVRRRSCTNPEPHNGGNNCVGACTEYARCNLSACPCDGGWSEWGAWSNCDITCKTTETEYGQRHRRRTCTNPKPLNGGRLCEDSNSSSKVETGFAHCDYLSFCTAGVWGAWTQWTRCTKSCGAGVRYRERNCDSPIVNYKHNYCPGVSKEEKVCNNQSCPCDGNYGDWGPWSPCSASCGVGNKKRYRFCVNPPPSDGGRHCEPPNFETASCYPPFQCPRGGEWTLWSLWTPCPAFCGNKGVRERWRVCHTSKPTEMYTQGYISGQVLPGEHCKGRSHDLEVCEPNYCEAIASLQPAYVCLSPKPLIDGSWVVTGSGSEETGYESGSTVSYQCEQNLPGVVLQLVGPLHRTCQPDGSWSDTEPACVPTGELTNDRFKRSPLIKSEPSKDSTDHVSPSSSS